MNGLDPAVDAFAAAAGARSGSGAFDLSEVDFEFVERCTSKDARKLANIVRALESDAGYPELLSAARKKLASIDPASAPLLSTPASRDEQRDAIADLASWTATAKAQESALRSAAKAASASSSSAAASQRHSIPIRGHAADSAFESAPGSASAELKKKNAAAGIDLGQELDPSLLTPAELTAAATSEKEKGNECFRAGEHADAVKFYTRALHLTPQDTTILNNRALTFLKQKNLDAAQNDVMLVLAADPTNWKGLWRRGQIHEAKLFLERALDDFKLAQESWARTPESRSNPTHPDLAKNVRKVQKALLETEPNHPYVAHLKEKSSAAPAAAKPSEQKESKEPEAAAATSFKRMAIAEVDDDESDEEQEQKSETTAAAKPAAPAAAPAASAAAPMRRMPIAEVDDDDDDEPAAAPAAAPAPAAKPAAAAAAAASKPAPAPASAAAPAPAKKPSQQQPAQPAFTSKSGGMMIELVSDEEEEEAVQKEKTAAAGAKFAAAAASAAVRPAASASVSSSAASSSSSSAFVVPPLPSSSVLFSRDWAELSGAGRSAQQRWAYLSQLSPAAIPKLFASGGALNSATFAGLLDTIVECAFGSDATRALEYLAALERTERFGLNVSMLDHTLKARVAHKLEQVSKESNEDVAAKAKAVRKRYV